MFCPYCGAQLADGAKFCDKCGKAIDSEAIQEIKKKITDGLRPYCFAFSWAV